MIRRFLPDRIATWIGISVLVALVVTQLVGFAIFFLLRPAPMPTFSADWLARQVRDVLLALFTGILLNVEKPFRVGDMVRINDKQVGKIERITWRTTVLQTTSNETVYITNLQLTNAVILNMVQPDARSKRTIALVIDYDTSVESAERILYAAALGAVGAGVIPSLAEAAELLPVDRSVEPQQDDDWRSREHERWKAFVRAAVDLPSA